MTPVLAQILAGGCATTAAAAALCTAALERRRAPGPVVLRTCAGAGVFVAALLAFELVRFARPERFVHILTSPGTPLFAVAIGALATLAAALLTFGAFYARARAETTRATTRLLALAGLCTLLAVCAELYAPWSAARRHVWAVLLPLGFAAASAEALHARLRPDRAHATTLLQASCAALPGLLCLLFAGGAHEAFLHLAEAHGSAVGLAATACVLDIVLVRLRAPFGDVVRLTASTAGALAWIGALLTAP